MRSHMHIEYKFWVKQQKSKEAHERYFVIFCFNNDAGLHCYDLKDAYEEMLPELSRQETKIDPIESNHQANLETDSLKVFDLVKRTQNS